MSAGIDRVLDDLDENVLPVLITLRRIEAFADYLTVDDLARLTFIMAPVGRLCISIALGDTRTRGSDDDEQAPAAGVGVRRDT